MTLKKCPCCNEMLTTKKAKFIGRIEGVAYVNCTCMSTLAFGKLNVNCPKVRPARMARAV